MLSPLRSGTATALRRQNPGVPRMLPRWNCGRHRPKRRKSHLGARVGCQVGGGCLHHQKMDEQKIDPNGWCTLVTPFISGTLKKLTPPPPPLQNNQGGFHVLKLNCCFWGGVGTFYLHLAAQNPWQNRNVGRLTGDFCQLENDWVLQGCKVLWQKQCQESKKKWLKVMLGVLDRLLRLIDRNLEP